MLTVTQTAMAAAQQSFPHTGGVVVAVAVTVTMTRGVSIHIDFGPCLSRSVHARAGVGASPGTTGAPAVPDIVALGTVMDEDEEAKRDGEGTIKTAEDHVQEMTL